MKKKLFIGVATLIAAVAIGNAVSAKTSSTLVTPGICDYSEGQGTEAFGTCIPSPVFECDVELNQPLENGANANCPR